LTLSAKNVYIDEEFALNRLGVKMGRYVVISVKDSGTGIPPEVIEKIYDPFFTTKEVGKGTGLGLSTVHSIVKSHGGFINVESEVGKGTEFKVYLPALEAGVLQAAGEKRPDLPAGQGELVLVVDDEAAVCQITRATLESYGYRAITAKDGREAVEIHHRKKGEIKVILTDMMMPFMNGLETIRAVRKHDHDVKIIASSGLAAAPPELEGNNVEAFLTKPYSAEKLLTLLDHVLHRNAPATAHGTSEQAGEQSPAESGSPATEHSQESQAQKEIAHPAIQTTTDVSSRGDELPVQQEAEPEAENRGEETPEQAALSS
jgi:CheY-like chemotaxis protein